MADTRETEGEKSMAPSSSKRTSENEYLSTGGFSPSVFSTGSGGYDSAGGYGSIAAQPPAPLTPGERDRLLLEHLPTVRFVARRIHERLPQHVDMEDLVSAGMVGLIDAFSKFDHAKQVQFKSYAQFRIRGAILDSLRTLDWSPRELRRKGRAIEETIRSLTQQLGRAPSENEIAAGMEVSLSDYQQLLGDLKGLEIGSLNLERNEDGGDDELSYLPGTESDEPLFRCLKGELRQRLIDAIETLPDKERMVLTLYYYEELTMKEIGLTLGVVESRVSQIHSAAVVRLRAAMADLGAEKAAAKNKTKKVVNGR
jgi:RNA polymerase sigma factor for flagellar operon FliA